MTDLFWWGEGGRISECSFNFRKGEQVERYPFNISGPELARIFNDIIQIGDFVNSHFGQVRVVEVRRESCSKSDGEFILEVCEHGTDVGSGESDVHPRGNVAWKELTLASHQSGNDSVVQFGDVEGENRSSHEKPRE